MATTKGIRAPIMCGKGSPISVSIWATKEDNSPYGSSFIYYVHTPETLTTSHTQDTATTYHKVYGHGLTLSRVWLLALRHALRVLNKRRTLRPPNKYSTVIGVVQNSSLATAYNARLPVWKAVDFQQPDRKLLHEVSLR